MRVVFIKRIGDETVWNRLDSTDVTHYPLLMKIKIRSDKQFGTLLNALVSECVRAEIYFKLYNDLRGAIPEYKEVFNQSNTFWSLTSRSLLDATLSSLCRVYDQHSKSLSLTNLLDTIEANLEIFNTDNFKERLRGNPFADSLAQRARRPNEHELAHDKELVSKDDCLVKKLIIWRNNIVSHRTAQNVVNEKDITKDYPLTINEISELLTRATAVSNDYSSLFQASTTSTKIVGDDDYLYVLRTIKESITKQREEFAAQIANRHRLEGQR